VKVTIAKPKNRRTARREGEMSMNQIVVICGSGCRHKLSSLNIWVLGVGNMEVEFCQLISPDNLKSRIKSAFGISFNNGDGMCVNALRDGIKKYL